MHERLIVTLDIDRILRVQIEHNYLRGWIQVDAAGTITAYELDTSVASLTGRNPGLAERIGTAVVEHLPGAHAVYVRAGTRLAEGFSEPARVAEIRAKCEAAGVGGTKCELLRDADGDPWCGACGCPNALKRGCPQNRWK